MMINQKSGFRKKEWIFIILLCIIFGLYYYGIHLSFSPDPESIYSNIVNFYRINYGEKYPRSNVFWEIVITIATQIAGISYRANRLAATGMYFLILFFTFILSAVDFKNKKINFYTMPVFIMLMVILHPGSSLNCGQYTEVYHVYPFDMHTGSTVFAILSLLSLEVLLRQRETKGKWIAVLMFAAILIEGMTKTDLLYYIVFIIPLCLIGIKWAGQSQKGRNILAYGILFFAGSIMLLKIVSLFHGGFDILFNDQSVGYGAWTSGETIYGSTDFVKVEEIGEHIVNFIAALMGLFNIDFSGKSILNFNTLIYSVRITILFIAAWLVKENIKRYFKPIDQKNDKINQLINLLLSMGILFNCIAFLGTSYGNDRGSIRYMTAVVPYVTILLCRNVEMIRKKIGIKSDKFRLYFFLFGMAIVISNISPVWRPDEYKTFYEQENEKVAEILKKRELKYGLATHWNASTLTALNEGEIIVSEAYFDGEFIRRREEYQKIDYEYNYFILSTDGWFSYGNDFNYEKLVQIYGEPANIYGTELFMICVYDYNVMDIAETGD